MPPKRSTKKSVPKGTIDTSDLSDEGSKIVSAIVDYFEDLLEKKEAEITKLKSLCNQLDERVMRLEEQIDDGLARESKDVLIISGNVPQATEDEDCKEVILELLSRKLQHRTKPNDILYARRIGTVPDRNSDVRSILFKLANFSDKSAVLKACRKCKPDIFINESLTPTRRRIMFVLRNVKKKFPGKISSCRSFGGNVTVFIKSEDAPNVKGRDVKVILNTKARLEEFLRKEMSTTILDVCGEDPFTDVN